MLINNRLTFDLIKQEFPEVVAANQKILDEIREIRRADQEIFSIPSDNLLNRAMKLRGSMQEDFDLLTASLPLHPIHFSWYNTKFKEFLSAIEHPFKDFEVYKRLENPSSSSRLLDEFLREANQRMRERQIQRRQKEVQAHPYLRKSMERLLRQPELNLVQVRYQDLSLCERTPLGP
jgi:hypothetical protein